MSTKEERELVFEHWFRILIGPSFSISDITRIINDFADQYEIFDQTLTSFKIKIDHEGRICYNEGNSWDMKNTFGIITAKPGNMYHWKLKIIQMGDTFLNIGVIAAGEAVNHKNETWWNTEHGFSYFARSGGIYTASAFKRAKYGDAYGKDDIIHIWLDLRENKNELSFGKNDEKFGKAANVKESTNYRLAIGMFLATKKIEILSFEISK